MSFLDSKEQVIDLVLTKHGKEQISKGLFSPSYYAFVDDDILYNSTKAGISETQNATQRRIVEETPKTSFIINAEDLSTNKFKPIGAKKREDELYKGVSGLSNSELGSQTTPRFDYICLKNKISASAETITVQSASHKIPQLDFDLNVFAIRQSISTELFNAAKLSKEMAGQMDVYAPEEGLGLEDTLVEVFNDNTAVKVKKGRTIGLLLETGGSKVNDTFELDFYLVKLATVKKNKDVTETVGILTQLDPYGSTGEVDTKNALDYYLDVQTEDNLSLNLESGFSVASGLYNNLPEIEEDFC